MNQKTKKTSRRNNRVVKKKKSLKRKILLFLFKVFLVLAAVSIIYGIYLDQQIKERIDGHVWELPAAVYGRIVELEPEQNYQLEEIVSILNGVQYRQKLVATRPGEFVVHDNRIEIYRRPFRFPDVQEPAFRVKITFKQNHIDRITNIDNGRQFGVLRIDPRLITMMHSPNREQRLFIPLKDFPDSLIKTLVAAEDKRFHEHNGISLYSIGRAIYTNLIAGRTVQGGSTLTQQLVKNLFLTNERSYIRKIREAYMAIILDARYSKERILELYLNEVYLGQNKDEEIHGFPLASLYYFGRPVSELSLDQQALLVGMVRGASYYNPWTKPQRALEVRNVVLKLIQQQELIDNELYENLHKRPLGVLPKGGVITPRPAFIQLVRQALKENFGSKINELSGVKIFTTFDPITQNSAETAVIEGIKILKERTHTDLQMAAVVVDRITGEVRSVIGSSDPSYAGFNRALYGRRPIGSLAKPPTYLTALSQPELYHLNTWLEDKPLSLRIDSRTVWRPKNFDEQYRDKVMMVDALAYSLNVPSVNLGLSVGLEPSAKVLLSLGVPKTQIKSVPSRFLGTLELTPLETAQMYQTIGNGGKKSSLSVLRYVVSENGELIYQHYPNTKQVVSSQASYLTVYAMQKVAQYGTSRVLNSHYSWANLAAKTGTTNDLRDSWFVGIDGKDVMVIWIGLDDHKPMKLTGASGALSIYQRYLAQKEPLPLQLPKPANIYMVNIDNKGRWICDGSRGVRTLPAWTSNPQLLCAGFNQVEKEDLDDDAPNWLKEMFGF